MFEIHPTDYPQTKEGKEDRRHLIVWVGRVLLCVAILIVAAIATSAHAGSMFATNGRDWARLLDKPCTNKLILDQLPTEVQAQMKAAEVEIEGTFYKACWADVGEQIFLKYEDGDKGLITKDNFRPEGV